METQAVQNMLVRRKCLTLFYLFELEQNVRDSAMQSNQNIQLGDKAKGGFSLLFFNKTLKGWNGF
jgi:hypothetical protein